MASIATPTVTGNYHTPICGQECNLRHHDLVSSMFCGRSCTSALFQHSWDLPVGLKLSVHFAKLSGWNQNSDVPDPLEELRCPLLCLACAFGKTHIVKALLQNNFDPRVVNKYGETALHCTAQNLWSYKVVPCGGAEQTTTNALESFEQIVEVLTYFDPKILVMKDDSGRTALHVLATNIMLCQNYSSVTHGLSFSAAARFHQLCLKSMIRRIQKLLDDSMFTRHEAIEIITTAESTYGDSVLHILARDSAYGFEILKFLQNCLFAGKLPNIENGESKTVLTIALETDPQGAKEMFFNSPVKEFRHRPQYQQESATQSMQFEKTLISTDGDVSTITAADVTLTEPQANHFEQTARCPNGDVSTTAAADVTLTEPQANHFERTAQCPNLGTGDPIMQFTYPVTENEGDLPYITHVFSLSGNNGLKSGKIYNHIYELESLTMPSSFGIAQFPVEGISSASANAYLNKACNWVETCTTTNNLVGLNALAPEKQSNELGWNKELLFEERNGLKRKVDYCQEKQSQFVNHCKQVRLW